MNKKLPVTLVTIGAVAVLGLGLWKAQQPGAEAFQGQMEVQEVDVASKVSARIADILVKEGDVITVGSPLIRLDSPEVTAKLAQATAAQEAAQATAKASRAALEAAGLAETSATKTAVAARILAEATAADLVDAAELVVPLGRLLVDRGLVHPRRRGRRDHDAGRHRGGLHVGLAQLPLPGSRARTQGHRVACEVRRLILGKGETRQIGRAHV
mgnify:CR=1 FL=1